jgi:hypothetical protein
MVSVYSVFEDRAIIKNNRPFETAACVGADSQLHRQRISSASSKTKPPCAILFG